jgi:glutamate carboxypeptidase
MSVELNTGELTAKSANEIREHFVKRRDVIENRIREVVEIESPSGDAEGSRKVVEKFAHAANEMDVVSSVERLEISGYGEHLRVTAFGDAAGDREAKGILLLGHTDTVHPRGSLAARPVRVEGERMFAPGIFDMKANIVIALESLRLCGELGLRPRLPVRLLLTCDEETGSEHGRAFVEDEARRASHVLVLEPSADGGAAKTSRKGTGWWTLRAKGRASHAGLKPQDGASAILELARHTTRFHEMSDFTTGTTFNVGTFNGGTCSNVVAADAIAELDVRFSTMAEAMRVENLLSALAPVDEKVELIIEGGINRPPLERTAAVAELYEHARRIASVIGGYELGEAAVGGASDGNFAAGYCPAVLDGLGLQGGGAHADDEHILRSDIPFRGALLAGLLLSL